MAALVAVSDEASGPMIDKREILEAASSYSLQPSIVEKDYVLGWILAGIYAHEELAENWIFKGGTCLKKCYFETYRFSEDLDFTLRDEEHLDEEFLRMLRHFEVFLLTYAVTKHIEGNWPGLTPRMVAPAPTLP